MTDRELAELKKLLAQMPVDDLTVAKRLLSQELDSRSGKTKFQPHRWDPELTTR